MTGWMAGSLLLCWTLCSALNAFVESQVIAGRLERRRGFLCMVAGLSLVLAGMLVLCLQVYPGSSQAAMLFLTDEQALAPARISALANGLFVFGYAGFQLRRFWEDD